MSSVELGLNINNFRAMSSKVVLTFLVSLQITFIIQAATFGIDQSMLETLDATRNALLAEMPLTKVIQKSRPMRKNIFKEVTAGITTFSGNFSACT